MNPISLSRCSFYPGPETGSIIGISGHTFSLLFIIESSECLFSNVVLKKPITNIHLQMILALEII